VNERPSAGGRLPPPFTGQGEAAYKHATKWYVLWQCIGVQCVGVMVVLVNLYVCRGLMVNSSFCEWRGDSCACRGTTSWDVLIGVRAWSLYVRRSRVCPCPFEGLAAGRALVAQAPGWQCLIIMGCHSVGDGCTVSGMVAQHQGWWRRRVSRNLCHDAAWCMILVARRTPFEGAPMPFRGARRGRSTGAGGTVPRNDADLSAQGRAVPAQCLV
jgi:hypothetical protein